MQRLPEKERAKTLLITGAAAGLGRMTALTLAEEGTYDKIIVADRDAKRANEVVDEINRQSGSTQAALMLFDLTDPESIENAVDKLAVDEVLPEDSISAVLLNGGALSKDVTTEVAGTRFEATAAINLVGNHLLISALLSGRFLREDVRIVGVSSEVARGFKGPPKIIPPLGLKEAADVYFEGDHGKAAEALLFNLDPYKTTNAKGTVMGLRMASYGAAKYAIVLWIAALQRRLGARAMCLTVSPGSTDNTAGFNKGGFSGYVVSTVLPAIMKIMGNIHKAEIGVKRYIKALTADDLVRGGFYCSRPGYVTGESVLGTSQHPGMGIEESEEAIFKALEQHTVPLRKRT